MNVFIVNLLCRKFSGVIYLILNLLSKFLRRKLQFSDSVLALVGAEGGISDVS